MDKFKDFLKKPIALTLVLSAYVILVFLSLKSFSPSFVAIGDYNTQDIPFYREFFRLLDNKNISWSWNLFLGNNFYSSKMYYLVGDIFAYIAYFIDKIVSLFHSEHLIVSLTIITIIKYITAGLTFAYFLTRISKEKEITYKTYLFSILYIFTGWSITFVEEMQFISFYVFIPLLLASVQDYYDHKYYTVIIAVILLIGADFYLLFSVCVMLLIYWITKYILENDKFNFKEFFIFSIKYLGLFIIGVIIASFMWLPAIWMLKDSGRIEEAAFESFSLIYILRIFTSFLMPYAIDNDYVSLFAYRPSYDFHMHYSFYQLGLYFGLGALILIPHYFTTFKTKKERIVYSIIILISILSLLSPKVGVFLYFTYSMRYTLLITIALLIISYKIFEKAEKFNIVIVIVTMLIIELAFFYLFKYAIPYIYPENAYNPRDIATLNKGIILIPLYSIILIAFNRINIKKSIIITCLVSLILLENYYYVTRTMRTYVYETQKQFYTTKEAKEYEEVYKKLIEYDKSFYRIYTDTYSTENELTYLGVPNTKFFDSVYNYYITDYLFTMNYDVTGSRRITIDYPNCFDDLNVKYAIVFNGVPSLIDNLDKEFIGSSDNETFYIYKLNDSTTLKTYGAYGDFNELYSNYKNMNRDEIDKIYSEKLLLEEEIENIDNYIHNNYPEYFDASYYDNHSMNFDFDLGYNSLIYLSIPADKGWKIYDNDKEIDWFKVNGGFIGLALEKGNHHLHLEYHVPLLKPAIALSIAGVIILIFVNHRLKKKDL